MYTYIGIRWAGHVERVRERRVVYRVLVGNLRERGHLEDPGVARRIILSWIFRDREHGLV